MQELKRTPEMERIRNLKAVVKFAPGPEGIDLCEKPIPEIGEGDLLVKIKAAGLCGSDLHIYRDVASDLGRMGVTIGHEFSGEVVRVGQRVKYWKKGDRVSSDNTGSVCGTCHACISGEPIQCRCRLGLGSDLDGGFAEYVKIGEEVLSVFPGCLVHVPDGISFEEAAILDPLANGYCAVVQHGYFLPGESVAVVGAGPLGLSCINSAKIAGAVNIVSIVRSTTNAIHRNMAKKLGATRILESDRDDIRSIVDTLTNGEGLACVYECAGPAQLLNLCTDITRNGGKVVRVGIDFSGADCGLSVINKMLFRNISLVGHNGYNPVSWKNCINLLGAGMLNAKDMITHVLPLEDYHKGVQLMLNREAIKVVFKP